MDLEWQKLLVFGWVCVRSAEPELRHDTIISAARSRYACTEDFWCAVFVTETVPGKIEDIWRAPRLCACPAPTNNTLLTIQSLQIACKQGNVFMWQHDCV